MHLTPTPQELNEPFLKVLRWGFVVMPLPALTAGYIFAGEAGALAFVMLGAVAILLAAWGLVGVNLVRHHFAERKAAHSVLQHPKICRRLCAPRMSVLLCGLLLVAGSAPFVLGASALADGRGEGAWLVAGVLMLTALLLQWIGGQRVSDYLLVRRAWREENGTDTPRGAQNRDAQQRPVCYNGKQANLAKAKGISA